MSQVGKKFNIFGKNFKKIPAGKNILTVTVSNQYLMVT